MTKKITNLTAIVFSILLLFISCNIITENQKDEYSYLKVGLSLGKTKSARTVFPSFDTEEFDSYKFEVTDENEETVITETFSTYSAFSQEEFKLLPAEYTFSLEVTKGAFTLSGSVTETISEGNTSVSIPVGIKSFVKTTSEKTGTVNIRLTLPQNKEVYEADVSLMDDNLEEIYFNLFADEELASCIQNDLFVCTLNDIPENSGTIAINLFATDENHMYTASVYEYVYITDDTESKVNATVEAYDRMYLVTYELGEGSFTEDSEYQSVFDLYTTLEGYTLPTEDDVECEGAEFGGWFLDEQFQISAQNIEPMSECSDITLYALWNTLTPHICAQPDDNGVKLTLYWNEGDEYWFPNLTHITEVNSGTEIWLYKNGIKDGFANNQGKLLTPTQANPTVELIYPFTEADEEYVFELDLTTISPETYTQVITGLKERVTCKANGGIQEPVFQYNSDYENTQIDLSTPATLKLTDNPSTIFDIEKVQEQCTYLYTLEKVYPYTQEEPYSSDKLVSYNVLYRNEPFFPEINLETYIQILLTTGKSFKNDMPVRYLIVSADEWVYEFSYAFNLEDNPAMFVTKTIVSEPTPTHRICTVHFDSMGGTQIADRQYNLFSYFNPDDIVIPSKENKVFEGWCSDESLTESTYYNYQILNDVTLYAKYVDEISLTIKDISDGSVVQTVTVGKEMRQNMDVLRALINKENYMAIHLYSDSTGTEELTGMRQINEPAVLYAKFIEVEKFDFDTVNITDSGYSKTWTAPEDGTYLIQMAGKNEYKFFGADRQNDVASTKITGTVNGEISFENRNDTFTSPVELTLSEGDELTVTAVLNDSDYSGTGKLIINRVIPSSAPTEPGSYFTVTISNDEELIDQTWNGSQVTLSIPNNYNYYVWYIGDITYLASETNTLTLNLENVEEEIPVFLFYGATSNMRSVQIDIKKGSN